MDRRCDLRSHKLRVVLDDHLGNDVRPYTLGIGSAGNQHCVRCAIGVVFLKERLNLARLASITATLVGTAILKFSR